MKNRVAVKAALAAIATVSLALPTLAGSGASSPAPTFDLPSRDGKEISLAQYKGQVGMINFWASWCGPCRTEMPLLETMYKTYGKRGFVLLGVNVEPDSNAANNWLKQTPVSFPVLYDTKSKVSSLYNVTGMPTTVFIDRKGNVRMVHQSYKAGDENTYMSTMMSLLKE